MSLKDVTLIIVKFVYLCLRIKWRHYKWVYLCIPIHIYIYIHTRLYLLFAILSEGNFMTQQNRFLFLCITYFMYFPLFHFLATKESQLYIRIPKEKIILCNTGRTMLFLQFQTEKSKVEAKDFSTLRDSMAPNLALRGIPMQIWSPVDWHYLTIPMQLLS